MHAYIHTCIHSYIHLLMHTQQQPICLRFFTLPFLQLAAHLLQRISKCIFKHLNEVQLPNYIWAPEGCGQISWASCIYVKGIFRISSSRSLCMETPPQPNSFSTSCPFYLLLSIYALLSTPFSCLESILWLPSRLTSLECIIAGLWLHGKLCCGFRFNRLPHTGCFT